MPNAFHLTVVSKDVSTVSIVTPADGRPWESRRPAHGYEYPCLQKFRFYTQLFSIRAYKLSAAPPTLHDIAQLSGERKSFLAFHGRASINSMSPPIGVQARPMAIPGLVIRASISVGTRTVPGTLKYLYPSAF